MRVPEILTHLESLRNESTFTHNAKYGAVKQFGVKLGDIRPIAKKIKVNHELAFELWDTGYVEARLLATLIVNPKKLSAEEVSRMAHTMDFVHEADWFNSYVLKDFPDKEQFREQWMDSDNKWAARSGWSLMAGRVAREPEGIDIDATLSRIEKEMPTAPPEVQWTMNTTLANIGINHPGFRQRALEIGEKLGIYRDYPVSKGCTSPFAPIWINEMVKRQQK
ncbi:DNA alkylation repair protein [Flavobacterium sp. MFBS3-15]|uniref:DNA alkylation repair protein n=1 Tax=Flavobacterium sp. MFBS3-15 TaxID=2989816 RepID=UPI00223669EB|nr:DNA alkylation repair protein [Flavobacterium sp. MFBS3-15]MCW4469857.1 DNA alkylation repair protein [Flavobacterium sp. MFBS3-15]